MAPIRLLALLIAAAVLLGCGPSPGATEIDPEDPAGSTAPDADAIAASLSDEEVRAAATSVNGLGFDLLAQLTAEAPGENVVISPLSAAVLLALLRTGAGEDAEAAINTVLGLEPDAGEQADRAFAGLLYRLRDTDDVDLAVANGLFAAPRFAMEPAFIERTGRSLEATLATTDLAAQEGADRIDEWAAEATEGLIDEFAEQLGLPDANAVLVLLNAVYFKGTWTTQFDPDRTDDDGTFFRDDGSEVTVPLMHEPDMTAGYRTSEDGTLGRLAYGDEERYGMEVLLPPTGTSLDQAIGDLDAESWTALTADVPASELPVWLPRFESDWSSSLDEALQNLGMGDAYSDDYAPMSAERPQLSTIQQKTFIRVDEEGTEAAAVTGGMMVDSEPAEPEELRVDRSFVFAITDAETGTILFLGAITDPTA